MVKIYPKLSGIRVNVDEVLYMPDLETPPDRPYPFVYFLSIINESQQEVEILGRKWIVQEVGGETQVVEGQGVIGETPRLLPGEKFSYNSYHVVRRNSVAGGSFFGVCAKGEKFSVVIPEFKLTPPGGKEPGPS